MGQQDRRPQKEIAKIVAEYVNSIATHTVGLDSDKIFNMDETPCFFDMASCTTIHFKGDKNVEGLDTGHRKSRFTVVLCVSLSGRVIKTQIIFKNLKKAPKIANLPPGVLVSASKGGSMNTPLMEEWLRGCFSCRGPYFAKTPSLLMMDQYGSHVKKEVVDMIKKQYSTKILLVPKKCSYFSQPLDVAVNSAFKAALRREWEAWFQHGKKEYTQKGYRRRPPYQATVDMVSNAVDAMKSDSIQKAFRCCGVAANGEKVSYNELNSRLQSVIALAEEATGIVQQGDQNPFQGLEDEDDDEEFSDNEDIVLVDEGGNPMEDPESDNNDGLAD